MAGVVPRGRHLGGKLAKQAFCQPSPHHATHFGVW